MARKNPRPPAAGEHLFELFRELCVSRRPGYSGPLALEPTQIEAWVRLRGVRLQAWELTALLSMDIAYLAAISASSSLGQEISEVPMSTPLFDALFGV